MIKLKNMLCQVNGKLSDVLEVINDNAKGIAFIVDEDNKLVNVLSDGDVRRLLLSGYNLHDSISKFINKDFVFAKNTDDYQSMMSKINKVISTIPIVDDDFRVVDYFEYKSDIYIPVAIPDLRNKEFKYLMDAFLSTWISSSGEYLNRFEKEFSEFCGCKYGIAVSNGTVALQLALLALGVGKGDEVIVPDLTFAATINAVLHVQAKPVIVDIEKDSWCIDPKEINKAITSKTKAIIPVHLYGQPCNMKQMMNIAKKRGIYVIEDAAEAHGAKYDGHKVGSFGDAGCFSFYGNKIITTGEGGMCVTNSRILAEKMRVLKDHGMSKQKKYWHDVIGYNFRMTNLQAAIGVAQLQRIDTILANRQRMENKYKKFLSDIDVIEFQRNNLLHRDKITWLVCVLVQDNKRDYYISKLKEKNIDVRPFFYSLGSMPIYKNYVFSNKTSLNVSASGMNLPTNSLLNDKTFNEIGKIFRGGKNV